jgi:dsRNA-specific ribonuclease
MYSQKNLFKKEYIDELPKEISYFFEDPESELNDDNIKQNFEKSVKILGWMKNKTGYFSIKYEHVNSNIVPNGTLKLIPFCSHLSTECRLEGTLGDSREMTIPIDYRAKMLYLNVIIREWANFEMNPWDVKNKCAVKGMYQDLKVDNCFDCALEQKICEKFTTDKGIQDKVRFNLYQKYLIHSETDNIQKLYFGKVGKNVQKFFSFDNILNITIDNLMIFGNVNLTREDLLYVLQNKRNYSLLMQSITHKSISTTNYEKLELYGDRIFEVLVSKFFVSFPTNNIGLLADYINYFTSGEVQTNFFVPPLRLNQVIQMNDRECLKKVSEDVLEAYIAALCIIFDEVFACYNCEKILVKEDFEVHKCEKVNIKYENFANRLSGMQVCENIIRRLLGSVNLVEYEHLIFPPKTELKEMLTMYKINFDESYSVSHVAKDWNVQEYKISLNIKFNNSTIERVYKDIGTLREVERKACNSFIKDLKHLGFVTKIKEKHLGLY